MKANLSEVMESIQGEGLLIGSRQIFVRFAGCNLNCVYCDTPESLVNNPCRFSPTAGTHVAVEELANPLSIDQVMSLISTYNARWVSLTGGEPLLWADFISHLAPRLKTKGYQLLLETNGVLHQQLDSCLPYIDMISMDIKTVAATGSSHMQDHALFLAKSAGKPLYVKIVIDANLNHNEIEAAAELIKSVDPNIPLILQPVTPRNKVVAPTVECLLKLQQACLISLNDVRIIPQIHKILQVI